MRTFFRNAPEAISGTNGGKIVAMDRFRSGRSLSPLRQVEAYWSALLTGDGVPRRSDIDPRGLENILKYTFILERIAPGIARFRLAGSHLNELAGMEVRGMPLTAFFEGTARGEVSAMLEHLFDAPAIGEVHLKSSGRLGRPALEARMILLPLKSDLGDVSRLLGVLVADGTPGKTPRRFALETTQLRELTHLSAPVQKPVATSVPPQPATGLAEDQTPFQPKTGHLRLVASRDD